MMKIMFVLVALKLRIKHKCWRCLPVSAKSRKENFPDRLASLSGSSSLLEFSARGINPIKLVYDPDRPDGRLNLTASTSNQLGQYTMQHTVLVAGPAATYNSPFSSFAVALTISSSLLIMPTHGWTARLSWLHIPRVVYLPEGCRPYHY